MTAEELNKELDKVSQALKSSEARYLSVATEVVTLRAEVARLGSLLTQRESEISVLQAETAELKRQNPTS